LLSVPALSVELFRYRGAAKDGGPLDYVFDAGEQDSPYAVTKEKAAEIAADFMTTTLSRPGRRTGNAGMSDNSRSIWLICFSDAVKGPLHQMFFVVLLPNGAVVEPTVARRM